jgi:hypothetical protein
MKLDAKALDVAVETLRPLFREPVSYLEQAARDCIAAYLTAAPPAPVREVSGNSGELIDRLRAGTDDGLRAWDWMREAADALTALSARLAECEAEKEHMRRRGEQREEHLKIWLTKWENSEARLADCENENYELRLIIMGGEDAPGFAGSVPLNTLRDQMARERLDMSQSLESATARVAALEAALKEANRHFVRMQLAAATSAIPRQSIGEMAEHGIAETAAALPPEAP